MATSLSAMLPQRRKNKPADFGLTAREVEILTLISQGMSNREIANKLFLSEGTVRNYVTGMLSKLHLRDRTQLAIFFLSNL